jgi:hypothetical protein
LRLLLKVGNFESVLPEWLMISAIALLFVWGFSKRKPDKPYPAGEAEDIPDQKP